MNQRNLIDQLKRHEGIRLFPYRDTVGKLTIGIGRNLDDVGISEQEAETMLLTDIAKAYNTLKARWPKLEALDDARQNVLINMAFNIGVGGLLNFNNMLAAIAMGDYTKAAAEMLNSKWARQVGARARQLAKQMETGLYA